MTGQVRTAAATAWKIDAAHSTLEFAVKHMMFTTVKGRFTDVAGTVEFDEADPTDGRADITIAAASIDTREPKRDAHLKSADFLEVLFGRRGHGCLAASELAQQYFTTSRRNQAARLVGASQRVSSHSVAPGYLL